MLRSAYRINHISFKQASGSMCKCHNETVNIWTHLIGAVGFFSLCFIILLCYENWHLIGSEGPEFYQEAKLEHKTLFTVSEYLAEDLDEMEN